MKALLSRFRYHIAVFFAVLGPGFITAVVDNDAGGILTYSQAGAQFGYLPLWTLLPITLLLIITQEMCSRMGAVTGKGLSRPDPRRVRPAHHVPHDGAAGGGEPDQRDVRSSPASPHRSSCSTSAATSPCRWPRWRSGSWW